MVSLSQAPSQAQNAELSKALCVVSSVVTGAAPSQDLGVVSVAAPSLPGAPLPCPTDLCCQNPVHKVLYIDGTNAPKQSSCAVRALIRRVVHASRSWRTAPARQDSDLGRHPAVPALPPRTPLSFSSKSPAARKTTHTHTARRGQHPRTCVDCPWKLTVQRCKRIATFRVWLGVPERWTNATPQRRTCSHRSGVPSCRGGSVGVA